MEYFTPTIKELHVGYQCEVLNPDENLWEDFVVTKDYCLGVLSQWIEFKELRTPFLTKENIEKEFDVEVEKRFWYGKYWDVFNDSSKHNYTVKYRFENQHMEISRDDESDIVFDGYVRCVNEFKTLLKLLRVK